MAKLDWFQNQGVFIYYEDKWMINQDDRNQKYSKRI